MTYQIGDKIAHPLHGAGSICEIQQKRVDGKNRSYYVMHIPKGDMRVMIPTDTCDQIGIRPIIAKEQASAIFSEIPHLEIEEDSNWNKRYRENMVHIKSGDLLEVAENAPLREADPDQRDDALPGLQLRRGRGTALRRVGLSAEE